MNNSEKEALRWYLQGTRDARTAGRNSKNGDFEVACFLYQQAAENPVLGHSTLKLAERAVAYEAGLQKALDACRDPGRRSIRVLQGAACREGVSCVRRGPCRRADQPGPPGRELGPHVIG
jgi:hypothetical protein